MYTVQEIPGMSGGHMGQLRPGILLRTSQEIPGMSGGHMGQLRPGILRVFVENIRKLLGCLGDTWDNLDLRPRGCL